MASSENTRQSPFATLIAGPTASGKSALALRLALQQRAWIVNADSMQVYRDLAVLSARPSGEEEAQAPHHLFGMVPAEEEYSVGRYLADLAPLVTNARAGGAPLVIVGGTGLYFRAMTEGLVPTPPVPDALRALWRQKAAEGHDLHAELTSRDPARAAELQPADTPRLLRAIELHDATGRRYSEWLAENPGEPLLKAAEWRGIFLDPPRDALKARIDRRFCTMMEGGALDEVRALLGKTPALAPNLGVMKAHGVPHLAAHLRGEISRDAAIALGQQDTRAYARRQVIFARRYLASAAWDWRQSFGE